MRKFARTTILAGLLAVAATAVSAQSMPVPQLREVMVKSTLMTFNDANLTDNYEIFDARAADAFSQQFPPERLSEVFKEFRDQEIDLSVIVSYPPVEDPAPSIDADGILQIKGYFETSPSVVTFDLGFVGDENGDWRVVGINVYVVPEDEFPPDSAE